jgi:hypothetical protein
MPYIGNTPADKFLTLAKQSFSTSATTSYTLDSAVSSTQDIALFINNVRQSPVDAYTVSGTALTLTSATAGTDEMYCVYLGKTVGTVVPGSNTITNTMMTDDSVGLAELSATGTASSSTFLRGDNSWATPTDNGKILQVVSGTVGTTTLSNTSDYIGAGLSITPASTSNKVLIFISTYCEQTGGSAGEYASLALREGTTAISTLADAFMYNVDVGSRQFASLNFIRSPSSTSAVQYRLYHTNASGTGNYAYKQQTWCLMEVAA